jgi:hypothetical protein
MDWDWELGIEGLGEGAALRLRSVQAWQEAKGKAGKENEAKWEYKSKPFSLSD